MKTCALNRGNSSFTLRYLAALALLLFASNLWAATCTSRQDGNWGSSSTWTNCNGNRPQSGDVVVIASPNTVTLDNNYSISNLTINSGGTLDDNGNSLTMTGNLVNNGILGVSGGGGKILMTASGKTITGTGTYTDIGVYIDNTGITLSSGSSMNLTGSASIRVGSNSAGSLTVAGSITDTGINTGNRSFRVYSSSTLTVTGTINTPNSYAQIRSGGTVANNGTVSLQYLDGNSGSSGTWTQGTSSAVTFTKPPVSWAGVFNASNTGNTVTYNGTATPLTPSSNKYYNLAGSAVICPVTYTVLGTSPCTTAVGAGFSLGINPTCSSVTGVGTVAWSNASNARASDNSYATVSLSNGKTSNYLKCTGFDFSATPIPAGATIKGITVYVERRVNDSSSKATARDIYVYLIKAGTIQTTSLGGLNGARTTVNYPISTSTSADAYDTHGGATNLWNKTWNDGDLKVSNFGVALATLNTESTSNETKNRSVTVDNIYVRVDYVTASVDHFTVTASNVGSSCTPTNVVFAAHTAAHAAPTTTPGTIRISTSDNKGDWTVVTGTSANLNNGTSNDGAATYTFATGETNVTLALSHTTSGTVTIGVADNTSGASLLSATPASELLNTIAYSAGGFTITDSAGVELNSLTLTHEAGTISPSTLYLKATSATCSALFKSVTKTVDMAFECIDPTSCQSPVVTITNASTNVATSLQRGVVAGSSPSAITTYTGVPLNFNANSLAPFKLSYPDVGKITLYFRYSASSLLSESNPFVIKPAGFVLSNIKRTADNVANPAASSATSTCGGASAASCKFVKAGEAFTATVTAVTSSGAATPNFGNEVVPEGVILSAVLASGLGLSNNPPVAGVFGGFSGGAATGTGFSWNEVGIITLTPSLEDGDYQGTGDVQGTTSGFVGRFVPDHFETVVGAQGCGTFTYSRQPFSLDILAADAAGTPMQNYDGAFVQSVVLSDSLNNPAPGVFSTIANSSFVNGVATVTPTYTFNAAQTAPTQVGVRVADSDGTTSNTASPIEGTLNVRSGRLWLGNAYGSSAINLTVPLRAQYWNGSDFVTNPDDDALVPCTSVATPTLTLQPGGAAVGVTMANLLVAGMGDLALVAPNAAGTVDVSVTAPAWLQYNWLGAGLTNPSSRATFGVYKGGNRFIYRRERY